MSVKEMSVFLVSEGFSIVGNNAWEKGNVSILLDKGFLYVKHRGGGTFSFPLTEDDEIYITVFDGHLVIYRDGMVYTHKI